MMKSDQDKLKQLAGETAARQVESGMVIGLGYGSTAIHALRTIGEKLRSGELEEILGVPTAKLVARDATAAGIPLTTLEEYPTINLTIDGADEVDLELNLIKGGGGALMREKIVAQASERLIIVVDDSKVSEALGMNAKLPVEVLPFGWGTQAQFLEGLGAAVQLRRNQDQSPYLTDNSNYILDCDFGRIKDIQDLGEKLDQRAGIVEHGLFIGLADEVIIGHVEGVQTFRRKEG